MSWRVVVPLKPAGSRKTRLADRLDADAREALALAMLAGVVRAIEPIASPILLCAERPARWDGAWERDRGEGLNRELARLRRRGWALAVIHADLPLLTTDDAAALLAAAGSGAAVAPDRHRVGTNALAVAAGVPIDPVFGAGSFAAFTAQRPDPAIVDRPGLALDIDTAADLDAAIAAGFAPPPPS